MSISVRAYRKAELDHKWTDEVCPDHDHLRVGFVSGFEDRLDDLVPGCYKDDSYDDDLWFTISYSDYGVLRHMLSEMFIKANAFDVSANPYAYHSNPFFEFVFCNDHEITIGPKTCRKLADDFRDNADEFLRDLDHDDKFAYYYRAWQKAFEAAAVTGFVTLS